MSRKMRIQEARSECWVIERKMKRGKEGGLLSYLRLGRVLLLDGLNKAEDGFLLLRRGCQPAVDLFRFGEKVGLELLGIVRGCVWEKNGG